MSFLERLLGMGGNQGQPVPQATSQAAPQAQPMGQAPVERRGMFGLDFSDPKTAAALQMISNGLTPSVGAPRPMFQNVQQVTANAMGLQEAQRKRAMEEKKLQDETMRKNRTLGWIEENAPQYLEAVDLGFLSPGDVYKNLMNPNKTEYQQREELADQYGLPEGSPERLSFVLTNKLPDGGDMPNSVREFQFAQQNGFTGTYDEWVKSKTPQTNINMPGAPEIGTIPQGYETYIDPESNRRMMRPILGGPAQIEADKIAETKRVGAESRARSGNVVLEDIDRALEGLDDGILPTSGAIGGALSSVPGTQAFDVGQLIETIRANSGFDRLQAMRDSSPTGGALGAINQSEMSLLQAALGNLSQSQSEEQLKYNLSRVRRIYDEIVNGPAGATPLPSMGGVNRTSSGITFTVED
jgi:hypothetical protein